MADLQPQEQKIEAPQNSEAVETKHAGGRPKTYRPEILEKSKKYLEGCNDEYMPVIRQENTEKGYLMYENRLRVNLPSIEGLALYLRVNRDTIYAWAKEHEEFSDIIDELREKQAQKLLNSGLSGEYNSTIAKLILSKHGYVEKTATEHSGEIKGGLTQEQQDKWDLLLGIKKAPAEPEIKKDDGNTKPANNTTTSESNQAGESVRL